MTTKSEKMKAHWQSGRMTTNVYTPEVRAKMSEIKKQQFVNGLEPWNKGKEMTQEYKDTISKNLCGKIGEESRNWKGGIAYYSIRNIRLRENGGSHTFGEWETLKIQYNDTCPACKVQEPFIELVRDHIIPISKGGSNNIENIQPLCRSCNAKKHTEIIKFDY